jgi:hypothetical protein
LTKSSRGYARHAATLAIPSFLFVAVYLAYLPSGNMGCADSMWSIPTAVSLLDHGDANLDEYQTLLQSQDFHYSIEIASHRYGIYPIGASLVAIPGVLLLRPVAAGVMRVAPRFWNRLERITNARGCPVAAGEPIIALRSWTEHLIAAAIVAVTTVVIFLIARHDLSAIAAIAMALLFAFGTPAWSTASRSLWQHGPSMLMLALALLIQQRHWRLIWLGAVIAFAYVVRPTNIIAMAAVAMWVLLYRRHEMWGFLAGIAVVLVPFALFNSHSYGYPLPPYYRTSFFGGYNRYALEALAGNLISPSRGVLIYSPIFIFCFAGLAAALRSRRSTDLVLTVAASVVTHWIVISVVNTMWWGGASYGPRFFADVTPYLIYLLIPFVVTLQTMPGWRRPALATVFLAAALFSVGVHARGALNESAALWNVLPTNIDVEPVRVWDWRRPQFLAGITFLPSPLPPVNLDAIACSEPPDPPDAPAIVTNRRGTVRVEWSAVARHPALYLLEIGSARGLRDRGVREITELMHPFFIAWRVQPGTYYVRVRAANKCGDSSPSPEVVIVVP